MKILGISGKKQAGKDTLADFIAAIYPGKIVKVGFATALKREVAQACNVSIQCIEENKSNFRKILQGWGTDFRRNMFGDDYWLRQMEDALVKYSEADLAIIPDVRFVNEAMFVSQHNGILVRVNRFNQVPDGDTHESETQLDNWTDWDKVIKNDSGLTALLVEAQTIYTTLLK